MTMWMMILLCVCVWGGGGGEGEGEGVGARGSGISMKQLKYACEQSNQIGHDVQNVFSNMRTPKISLCIREVRSGPSFYANRIIGHHVMYQRKAKTKTCLYNFDPRIPHFYIVKLGFTGVYIIFLISAQKHRLWVLVRTASPRWF